MKPPIFVYCPNTLDVFDSVESAQRYIEPWSVKSGEDSYYDSDGQVLEAIVTEDPRGVEHCRIQERVVKDFQPETLRQLLIRNLRYLGRVQRRREYSWNSIKAMTLEELVAESLKFKTL